MAHVSPHSHPNHRASRVSLAVYDAGSGQYGAPSSVGAGEIAGRSAEARFVLEEVKPPIAYCRHGVGRIPWGAALRDDRRRVWAWVDGRWRDVEELTGLSRDAIRFLYRDVYKADVRVPDQWMFDDRGRARIHMFTAAGDLTPRGPGESAFGPTAGGAALASPSSTVAAPPSFTSARVPISYAQGTLRLRPEDLEEMLALGYLAAGSLLIVHDDTEAMMNQGQPATYGEAPFELHAFPRSDTLAVFGWQPNDFSRATMARPRGFRA